MNDSHCWYAMWFQMAILVYMFYMSKYVEFMDTVRASSFKLLVALFQCWIWCVSSPCVSLQTLSPRQCQCCCCFASELHFEVAWGFADNHGAKAKHTADHVSSCLPSLLHCPHLVDYCISCPWWWRYARLLQFIMKCFKVKCPFLTSVSDSTRVWI
jgi:hypothetical protein